MLWTSKWSKSFPGHAHNAVIVSHGLTVLSLTKAMRSGQKPNTGLLRRLVGRPTWRGDETLMIARPVLGGGAFDLTARFRTISS